VSDRMTGEVSSNERKLLGVTIALVGIAVILGGASAALTGSLTGQAPDPFLVDLGTLAVTVAQTLLLVAVAPLATSVTLCAMRARP